MATHWSKLIASFPTLQKFPRQIPLMRPGHPLILVWDQEFQSETEGFLKEWCYPWQFQKWKKEPFKTHKIQTQGGELFVIGINPSLLGHHHGFLDATFFSEARDMMGASFPTETKKANLSFLTTNEDLAKGALVGMGLSLYRYHQPQTEEIQISLHTQWGPKAAQGVWDEAKKLCLSINMARMLVDTPPNEKRPHTLAKNFKSYFQKLSSSLKVEVWKQDRLEKEKMGLHVAVGKAAEEGPVLLKVHYRPKKKSNHSPFAFVGKGIIFDSGGLDIKPPQAMRLMKKDMGGMAALSGVLHWVVESDYPRPLDFYFPLSENAVSSNAFRPGDVYLSRVGKKVEIDNTDAEGRLVMADSLALATEGKKPPRLVMDVATLTGAVKVGLGSDIGGLFSNDDQLADLLLRSSQESGDPLWRLPLLKKQFSKLKSSVADFQNSANGFGGAIRAATFLEQFIHDCPWIHLDIFAWNDSTQGPLRNTGGSGQAVQAICHFLNASLEAKELK